MKQYQILIDGKCVKTATNYYGTLISFITEIENVIHSYFGALGVLGLPFPFESYLLFDDELETNIDLKNKADDILDIFRLFRVIKNFTVADWTNLHFENISFHGDDWDFSLINKRNETIIDVKDGEYYLKTNVFSNYKYRGKRYFNFYLNNVVVDKNSSLRLGERVRKSILLN